MVRNNNLNSVILTNPDNNYNPYDAASPLPVTLSGGGGGGDATAANQTTMIGHLADIETAVQGTLAVSAASLPLPSGASSAANQATGNTSLASIDGKITACDTGSISGTVAVSAVSGNVAITAAALPLPSGASSAANQATGNTSLASIDGKITACDTGSISGTVAVSAVSGNVAVTAAALPLPSGASSAANQATGNTSLASIDGKITACDTGSISGTVAVSAVSGNVAITAAALPLPSGAASASNQATGNASLASIATAVGGTLFVKQNEVLNEGSYANAANNVSIANGAYSSVISIANINVCSVFYEDSSTSSFDSLKIEVSPDGTNYFDFGIELFPSQEGAVRKAVQTNLHVEGLTHMRLKNNSASDTYANVYGTIVGSP